MCLIVQYSLFDYNGLDIPAIILDVLEELSILTPFPLGSSDVNYITGSTSDISFHSLNIQMLTFSPVNSCHFSSTFLFAAVFILHFFEH